jgi:hypothetical protein
VTEVARHAATPDDDPTGLFYERATGGNSGPGGPMASVAQLDAGAYNRAARSAWAVCGHYAPESTYPQRVWCGLTPEHEGSHGTTVPGGTRVYW